MADSEKRTGAVKKSPSDKKQSKQANPISRYFRETRGELRKVTWPSRQESWRLTGIVLSVSLAMSAFLWMFDRLFSTAIRALITQIT